MPKFEKSRGNGRNASKGVSARRNFGGRSVSRGSNDRSSPRGGGDFRRNTSGEKTTVICAGCGDKCEVPFKPTSNKPVYCSSCFRKQEQESKPATAKEVKEIREMLSKIMTALKID